MNQTELLALIRSQCTELMTCGQEQVEVDGLTAVCLAENVTILDTWLAAGEPLPEQWSDITYPTGKPRRQFDGVVVADATHGTRGGYNKGCRCLECTKANRVGHAAYVRSARQTAKEISNGAS